MKYTARREKKAGFCKAARLALCLFACAVTVLFAIALVSCVTEPSDFLCALDGEIRARVSVTDKKCGKTYEAEIYLSANDKAPRKYVFCYLSPETLCGICEQFDGSKQSITLAGFEGAAVCSEFNADTLGAMTAALLTPSAVTHTETGGTFTEIKTADATYYADNGGTVREVSSERLRIIITIITEQSQGYTEK